MACENILYWGSGSCPCWRVMLVLEEKGVKFESTLLSFEKKEHKGEAIMKLNPRGQVPTLKLGDVVMCESTAACDYLESMYPDQGNRLHPKDPKQRALVMQRQHEMGNFTKALFDNLIYYTFRTPAEKRSEEELTKRKQALLDELKHWEKYLEEGQGYIAGSEFSMADVMFFPNVAFMVRQSFALSERFPKMAAYYDMVTKRKSVQATWPPHWKETPNMTVLKDMP